MINYILVATSARVNVKKKKLVGQLLHYVRGTRTCTLCGLDWIGSDCVPHM